MTEPTQTPVFSNDQLQAILNSAVEMAKPDNGPVLLYFGREVARLAVEQATADLRAANEALGKRQEWWNESLFRVQQALDKALAELDEARAELAQAERDFALVQSALSFWLPAMRDGMPDEIIKRIGDDAMLLRGCESQERSAQDAGWIDAASSAAKELARLTTLRPMSEYKSGMQVVYHWRQGAGDSHIGSAGATAGAGASAWIVPPIGWTPLPPVKEADHPCGACSGTGWVPRDPDIGTDQECFVCDGSGKVKEADK